MCYSVNSASSNRALVKGMSEILFLCGSNKAAVIASLNVLPDETAEAAQGSEDEVSLVQYSLVHAAFQWSLLFG